MFLLHQQQLYSEYQYFKKVQKDLVCGVNFIVIIISYLGDTYTNLFIWTF